MEKISSNESREVVAYFEEKKQQIQGSPENEPGKKT